MSIGASFHHVSLSVADLDTEQHWYQQVLGLGEVVERFELPEPSVRTVVLRAPAACGSS
jgi:catechol 2,3-dioxygenase-like lactoylglutathione lyase family enzyme